MFIIMFILIISFHYHYSIIIVSIIYYHDTTYSHDSNYSNAKKNLNEQQHQKISALGHPRIAASKQVHVSVFLRIPKTGLGWPWDGKKTESR